MSFSFDKCPPRAATNSVKYDLRTVFFGTEDVLPMWVADMDFKTPPFIMEAIKQRAQHEIMGYSIRSNLFFESIQSWLLRRHHWSVETDSIVFSPGIVPALNLIVEAFTAREDAIMVQPPVYFPFLNAVRDNGRKLVENPLNISNGRLSIDFEDFEEKIKRNNVRMFILSSPHNPGGNVWTKTELQRMAEICKAYNVLILSDEIHADLVLNGHKHIPLASISEEFAQNCITAMAPSKTFNTAGLATSYLVIEKPELRHRFEQILNRVHVGNGNIFGNIALEAAYNNGDQWVDELLLYLEKNISFVRTFLREKIPGIIPINPEATYMIWLDCRALGLDDDALRDFFIKEARLGLNEGRVFGTGGSGFMRLNIAAPLSIVQQAMNQLEIAYKNRYRNETIS